MIMIEGLLIILILVGLMIMSVRKPKNYPPGPTPLPFVGHFYSIDHHTPQKSFNSWYDRFGPYVGLLLGRFRTVLASGWEAVNEAFLNEDLLGRPDVCLTRDRFEGENYGIFFTDGDAWRIQRRFTLHHFRNLGYGGKNHDLIMQEESEALVSYIRERVGKPLHIQKLIAMSTINITWMLLGGKRYDYSEEVVQTLLERIEESLHDIKMFGSIAIAFPFLRYIFPKKLGYTSITKGSKGILKFVRKAIREHEESRDRENPRDFLDIYLEELQKTNIHPSFSESQLAGICMDILSAGVDTSMAVVSFAILFLCLRKDLQNKAYEEILEYVGTQQIPSISNKTNLTYTDAVLMEVMRFRTPAPTVVPHRALKDTTLGGFHIPKDSNVIVNLHSVLMDKQYWGDPEVFRPERFITPEGKIRRDERLIPFGKGKRMCLGERQAKSFSFVLLASLIQAFSFSFDPNLPIPETEGIPGFTVAAPFFQVVVTPRG